MFTFFGVSESEFRNRNFGDPEFRSSEASESEFWGRDLEIPLYHTFALEYMIHMPVPEWGERKYLYLCVHDGVMVTERGVEFPARPIQEIKIIR